MTNRTILESHPISTLRKEISKTNIKGYSKMKKAAVVDLMLKKENASKFSHIKMREKAGAKPKEIIITPKRKIKAERAKKISAPKGRAGLFARPIPPKKRTPLMPKIIKSASSQQEERIAKLPKFLPNIDTRREYRGQYYFTDRYAHGSKSMQSKHHDGSVFMVKNGKWFRAGAVNKDGYDPDILPEKEWIQLPTDVKLYRDYNLREKINPEFVLEYTKKRRELTDAYRKESRAGEARFEWRDSGKRKTKKYLAKLQDLFDKHQATRKHLAQIKKEAESLAKKAGMESGDL